MTVRYADGTLRGQTLDFVLIDGNSPDSSRTPSQSRFRPRHFGFSYQPFGETFHMRHVIVEIDEQGKFSRGHVGEQENTGKIFRFAISDERLLGGIIHAQAA